MARPTKVKLERWFELEEQRLSLARQVKDVAALQEEIEKECLDHVREYGGPERVAMCCGFRLEITLHKKSVQWKPEFVKVAGTERAEELIAAAGTREVLKIESPK